MNSLPLDAAQCRIGRAALGLSEDDLARSAGLAPNDILVFEKGDPVSPDVVSRLAAAFAEAGVTFHAEAGRTIMRVRTLDGIIEAPVTLR